MVFMKIKLKLEEMIKGEYLDVRMNEIAISDGVPASVRDEGYTIISAKKIKDIYYMLIESR